MVAVQAGTAPARLQEVVQQAYGIVDAMGVEEVYAYGRGLGSSQDPPRGITGVIGGLMGEAGELPHSGEQGVAVLELTGGSTVRGAAVLLATGHHIAQVVYCEADERVAAAAQQHWAMLVARYPGQVLLGAEVLLRTMPQDLGSIQAQHLLLSGLHQRAHVAVFAGWCGDGRAAELRRAAAMMGWVSDDQSRLLFELQRLRRGQFGTKPLAYFIQREGPDDELNLRRFGVPILAGRVGANVDERRVWSNLGGAQRSALRLALSRWQCDPGKGVHNELADAALLAIVAIGRRLAERRDAHQPERDEVYLSAMQADPSSQDMTEEELKALAPRLKVLLERYQALVLNADGATPASAEAAEPVLAAEGEEAEQFSTNGTAFEKNGRRVPLDYEWNVGEADLPPECRDKFVAMLQRNDAAFSMSKADIGCMNHKEFKVGVNPESDAVWTNKRRLAQMHEAELDKVARELALYGFVIEAPDDCQFASPVLMTNKRDSTGKVTQLRMCVDYRALNERTPPDRYPMPLPEDLFKRTVGWSMFSSGDLMAGFHQARVAKEDQPKTAFHGPVGLLMYTRAPFGLKRMPNWFQREMEFIMKDTGLVFVDDVLTGDDIAPDYSNFDEHIATVDRMLKRLILFGVTLSPDKCHWAKRRVKFLGHILTPGHVQMEGGKVEAMLAIPRPTNATELLSWVHTIGYYAKLIDHHSSRGEPLRQLLKKDVPFIWGVEQEAAWQDLRVAITTDPVLALPDANLLFILSTDWSGKGMSAILSQMGDDGLERVVSFASRSNSAAECNYASYKGEMAAAVWGVEHYQYWLTGRRFKLVTDHQPLAFLMKSQKLTGLYYRWACRLSEYDLEIVYRPGVSNVADLPSRFPMPATDADWEKFSSDADYFYAERPAVLLAQVMHVRLQAEGATPATGAEYEPSLTAVAEFDLDVDVDVRCQVLSALAQDSVERLPDVWNDNSTMQLLQHGILALGLARNERHRARQRSQKYVWNEHAGQLFYVTKGGRRLVPRPDERRALVEQAHKSLGHTAVRRLTSALFKLYWWHDLWAQAADVCRTCLPCQQANATFTAKNPELQSLPMETGFHRVHTDLAGPFAESEDGCTYVMIIVDSFTKWLVLVGLRNKQAATTMAALRDHWVCMYGAPCELVMDNGSEWEGLLADFCVESGIERKFTSPDHPQGNGMAERMVGGCKASLKRYVADLVEVTKWTSKLQYIAMSYRFTAQSALRISPYRMVFGRDPVLPVRTREVFEEVVNCDDEVAAAVALARRVDALQRMTPLAMGNYQAALRRNEERYRRTRKGDYRRNVKWFKTGELAFLRQRKEGATFQSSAAPGVYRVVQVCPSGILVLQGRCGGTFRENGASCGPCLASHMDGSVDVELAKARYESSDVRLLACELCQGQQSAADRDRAAAVMLVCECCYTGWHQACAGLGFIPEGNWFCPYCVEFQGRVNTAYAVQVASLTQLDSADALEVKLNELMPGAGGWPRSTAVKMSKLLPGGPSFLQLGTGRPECVVTLPAEYESLLDSVDWSQLEVLIDPFAGTGTTRHVMQPRTGLPVVLSDIWPWSSELQLYNALEIDDMRELTSVYTPGSFAFVTSPWYAFNDVALPVMMACQPAAVFAHVPPWYVTDAHDRRRAWLQGYDVHLKCIDVVGQLGRRCNWLCIFRRGEAQQRLMRNVGDATLSWA